MNIRSVLLIPFTAFALQACAAQQGGSADSITPVELTTMSPHVAAPADPSKPVRISGGIIAGTLIKMTPPVFPAKTGCLHVSHTVVMRVIIGKDGHMKSVEVMSGADAMRQPTVDAVRQWEYKPFQLNGQPVDVETTVVSNPSLNCDGG
jgi:outer membrane biosynthesis protein TonB